MVVKKALPIFMLVLIIVVVVIQFATVADSFDTVVSSLDFTYFISHTIDDKDSVNVSVSYMVEEIGDDVYHISIWAMRNNSTDNPASVPRTKYIIDNIKLELDITETENVVFSSAGDNCVLSCDVDRICVSGNDEYVSLDLVITAFDENTITVKYDMVGTGFNYLSKFENIEIPLVIGK